MKKLAVFFPGIGYTADMPLLHYARRLAVREGFEIRLLPYSGFPQKVGGDVEKMMECYRSALFQSMEMLSETDLSDYEKTLFVGKSIGTVAAAEIAFRSPVRDRIHLLLYTPLEFVFRFSPERALMFTGSADPWVSAGSIPGLCESAGIPCHVISGANHSLETDDIGLDIENLRFIMQQSGEFIRNI